MNAGQPNAGRETGPVPARSEPISSGEARVYAYGIVRHRGCDLQLAPPIHGVSGSAVRALAHGGLAALVSDLPENVALDDVWQDAERVTSLALDHHRVLQRLVEDHTVLPLRFGAMFSDDGAVLAALLEHRHLLAQALERLDGAREWGLKIFCDHDVLRLQLSQGSDAVRVARARIAAAPEGHAFFLRRQLERQLDTELRQAVMRCVGQSAELLCTATRATATLNVHPRSIHGHAAEMVWNGACLVARHDENRFFAAINALRDSYRQSGFEYEHSGPWAPCSFADLSCAAVWAPDAGASARVAEASA